MLKCLLKRKDIRYDNHFPANIDFKQKIIVQIISKPTQPVVLYTCKETGKPSRSYLPIHFADKYNHGIIEL